ncbi:MAG: hypothetical protein ACJAWV_000467 [Flammeovirgaceae bacterium]|jgi:hypothetical protein
MFGFFKKKSKADQLRDKYKKLLEEAYKLSTSDRKASDLKTAEANEVMAELEALEKDGK